MPNIFHAEAKRTRGDKLDRMTGQRGEYPPDKAARIAEVGAGQSAQGDATKVIDAGQFTNAPARQVSNTGEVRK